MIRNIVTAHKKRGRGVFIIMWMGFKKLKKILSHAYTLRGSEKGVSEILGTILLLSIAITMISVLYVVVNTTSMSRANSYTNLVSIIGYVKYGDTDSIVFEHQSGKPLPSNVIITITILNQDITFQAGRYLSDTNNDNAWGIGEKINYDIPNHPSLSGLEIRAVIVNPVNNEVIMRGVIQTGEQGNNPFIQTLQPRYVNFTNITVQARCWYPQNQQVGDPKIVFYIKPRNGSNWISSREINAPNASIYEYKFEGLESYTIYLYYAKLNYTGGSSTGNIVSCRTKSELLGHWRFNESSGSIAYDSSKYENHGVLLPPGDEGPTRVIDDGVEGNALLFDDIDDNVSVPYKPILNPPDSFTIDCYVKPTVEDTDLGVGRVTSGAVATRFPYYTHVNTDYHDQDIVQVASNYTHVIYGIVRRNGTNKGVLYTIKVEKNTGRMIFPDDAPGNTSCFQGYFMFESSSCIKPRIIKVENADNIFAIVYTGPSNYGKIVTVSISQNGRNISRINETNLSRVCLQPDVIHLSSDWYAVVYNGSSAQRSGHISRFTISNNGVIELKDTYNFTTNNGDNIRMSNPNIVHVNDDIYAIVYEGDDYNRNTGSADGCILTVHIPANENQIQPINQKYYQPDNIEYQMKFETSDGCTTPKIMLISQNRFVIASTATRGQGNNVISSYIYAGTINNNGGIPSRLDLRLEIEHLRFYDPHLIKLSTDGNYAYCAVAYQIVGKGCIKTFSVNLQNNSIQLIHDIDFSCYSEGYKPKIINITSINGSGYYLIIYDHVDTSIAKTIVIPNTGSYTGFSGDPVLDSCELGPPSGFDPKIISVSNTVVAVMYRWYDYSGYIKTLYVNPTENSISNVFNDTLMIEKGHRSSRSPWSCSLFYMSSSLIHITTSDGYSYYAFAYYGGDRILMQIIKIDVISGDIEKINESDSDQINNSYAVHPDLIKIEGSNNIYGIVFRDGSYYGYLKTLQIDTSTPYITVKNSLVFNSSYCTTPKLVRIDNSYYGVVYQGWDGRGVISIVNIDNNGAISLVRSMRIAINSLSDAYPFSVNNGIIGVAYKSLVFGKNNTLYRSPQGIYANRNGLYFCDTGNNRIVKLDTTDMSYKYSIEKWNGGSLSEPSGICGITLYNLLYVTDTGNHRVVKLRDDGSSFSFVSSYGSQGSGNDCFNYPSGICTDGQFLYVTDTGNHRVVKLRDDGSSFSFVSSYGSQDSGNYSFNYPSGICTDGQFLYVTDTGNHRVVKLNASSLSFVSYNGSQGSGNYSFNYPSGICTDGQFLYVTDTGNHRVVKLDASSLSFVSYNGSYGIYNDRYLFPKGICFYNNVFYVTDTQNHRIKKLSSSLGFLASQPGSVTTQLVIQTMKINENGVVTSPCEDMLQYPCSSEGQPIVTHITNRIYSIIYSAQGGSRASISTFRIGSNGGLPQSFDSTGYYYSTSWYSASYYNWITPVYNSGTSWYYAIVYRSKSNNIIISLKKITAPVYDNVVYDIIRKPSSYNISIKFMNSKCYLTCTLIGSGGGSQTPIHINVELTSEYLQLGSWSRLIVTYDKPSSRLKIYLNNTLLHDNTLNPAITINPAETGIIIGGYPGVYDEIKVYARSYQ